LPGTLGIEVIKQPGRAMTEKSKAVTLT